MIMYIHITAELKTRIKTFETKNFRKLLGVTDRT